ncbi:MAG: LysM peptidoglycan-binding domain-containing protein [Caldilineae bacterium]|nr:MAG: LysM peptidoglycan-binding domain-containing protein [Caldilineae bacterium]
MIPPSRAAVSCLLALALIVGAGTVPASATGGTNALGQGEAPSTRRQGSPCGSRYLVRRGDTLSEIARRCGVSTRKLKVLNRIANPNHIRAGQVLRLTRRRKLARTSWAGSLPRIYLFPTHLPPPAPYP